jgi:DNA repair exonuclease SbcCD ATPase subunit
MADIRKIENFGVNERTLEDINYNFNELKSLAGSGDNKELLDSLAEISLKVEDLSTNVANNAAMTTNLISMVEQLDSKIDSIETKLTAMSSKINDILTKLNSLTPSA